VETISSGLQTTQVDFKWIKGHNNHPQNERCDELLDFASVKRTFGGCLYEKLKTL
jgi:ribonuclease HI